MSDMRVESQNSLQLGDYLQALRRRLRLMINIALPITLGAGVLAAVMPDVYRAEAVIDIEETMIPGYTESAGRDMSFADQYVKGLRNEVLNSEGVREILRKFDPFPGMDEELAKEEIRGSAHVQMITTEVLDPYSGRDRRVITAFSVGFESHNPETAAQVAGWLSDAYLTADRRSRERRAAGSVAFLGSEADRVREEIANLEAKLAEFKQENANRLPEQANMNLTAMDRTERELSDVQSQMRALQQDRIFAMEQLESAQQISPDAGLLQQLQADYNRLSAQYDGNHPDVVSLRRRIEALRQGGPSSRPNSLQADLDAKRAVLAQSRQRYSDEHPEIRSLQREIEALERRIGAGEQAPAATASRSQLVVTLETRLKSIETQLESLQTRQSELRRSRTELEQRIESSPQVEKEYLALTRDLSAARRQYEDLITKQMNDEVRQAAVEGGTADEFRLVRPASKPGRPVRPNRPAIVVVGVMLGMMLALSAAVLVDLLDPSVRNAGDIRRMGIQPLAVVPTINNPTTRRHVVRRNTLMVTAYLLGTPLAFLVAYVLVR